MAAGYKTGGRQKGTPNKRTAALAERLEDRGCDPMAALVEIAQDAETPRELRVRIYGDLLPFLYPRRPESSLARFALTDDNEVGSFARGRGRGRTRET